MMKLRPITVPKCCRQRRSARVKRRKINGSFNWTHFSSYPLEQGCMRLCSSYDGYSPSFVDRKMDLIFGARGHGISEKGDMMFTERENKANILKRLERPLTELESATQSTISDSTESGYMGENGYYTFNEYHSSEMCNSRNNSCGGADTYHWNQKKLGSGSFIEGKHGSTKTDNCLLWSVESFMEKTFSQRMDTEDTLEEAVTKNSLNNGEDCDKRYQRSYTSKQNPYSEDFAFKASSSNRVKGDESEHRRGKRKRKPKVHFDEEVPFSMRSIWRMRRLKIMRHLGLIAPPGSPFVINRPVRTAA